MPSILADFEYDIFISYHQNDNKPATAGEHDGWVTNFVAAMKDDPEFQSILQQAKSKHEAFKKKFFNN